jgi:hypothetical protein
MDARRFLCYDEYCLRIVTNVIETLPERVQQTYVYVKL